MSEVKSLILYSRSAVTADWTCPRKRYWNYEHAGRGISPATTSLELFLGTTVHDGLAAMAHGLDIDEIASAAAEQLRGTLLADTRPDDGDAHYFANEQVALVEGMLRGYYKACWPAFRDTFPEIVLVEQECTYEHDGLTFMAKPDLVVRDKEGCLWYIEYKTTSTNKEQWMMSWATAVQLHSSVRAVEAKLGEKVTGVIVQGLYKGYVSYDKQTSPFCYCLAPETLVLTSDMRWVPIGTVVEGDNLAGFDEHPTGEKHLRNWRSATVENLGRAKLPSVRLRFNNGRSVTCSKDHLWLTTERSDRRGRYLHGDHIKWVPASELVVGKSRIVKLLEPWYNRLSTYENGYLAAAFDGEGSLVHTTKSNTDSLGVALTFNQKPNEMLRNVIDCLSMMGIRFSGPYEREQGSVLNISYRPDVLRLLGTTRPARLLPKLNLDRLGALRTQYDPLLVVDIEDIGEQDVVTIQTSTRTLIADGLASHNCYHKPAEPPFIKAVWSYEYRQGLKKYPIWLREGGVKRWVDEMPSGMLSQQFPQAPPVFINDSLIDAFFRQRARRESDIRLARDTITDPECEPQARERLLDLVFPQNFEACNPGWGKGCAYLKLCHGQCSDPLQAGYALRQSHHAMEQEAIEAETNSNQT